MNNCDRCHKQSIALTMSYFNTQMICMECDKAEEHRPDYQTARDAERKAVQRGDFNFEGRGYPKDRR